MKARDCQPSGRHHGAHRPRHPRRGGEDDQEVEWVEHHYMMRTPRLLRNQKLQANEEKQ